MIQFAELPDGLISRYDSNTGLTKLYKETDLKFGVKLLIIEEDRYYIVEFSDGSSELFNSWDAAFVAGEFKDDEESESIQ